MLEHMPLHSQNILQSTQTLGSIIDNLVNYDLKSAEIQALTDISQFITINLNANRNASLSYLLTSTPSGYVAGKMFDTNVEPSNLKTIGTLMAGSFISGAVYSLVAAFTRTHESKTAVKITAAVIVDSEKALKLLEDNNKISTDTADEGRKAIAKAYASYMVVTKLTSAVLSLESIATAYHGYRRNNDSIGYGLAWGLTNGVGLGLALEQGYAQPLKLGNNNHV